MNIQPGDYVELAGLTDQQVEAVIERGEDTGWAIKDERLIDNKYILFLENDYICFTFKHPIDLNLSYPVRQLTIEQVLGVQGDVVKQEPMHKRYPKYYRDVTGLESIDYYRIADLFGVENQAVGHALKKLLLTGTRTGNKSYEEDIREAHDTLRRLIEMLAEDANRLALVEEAREK